MAAFAIPLTPLVFGELRARRLERRPVDNRRHGNIDPLFARRRNARDPMGGGLAVSLQRPQPGPRRQVVKTPERRTPRIGWIDQHPANGRGVPMRRTAPSPATHLLQAPTRLAQAQTIESDPGEYEPDDARLFLRNLEARDSAAFGAADIAIAERRPGKRAHRPGPRSVPAPTTAALQNLGSFVFSDDALNLEQDIVLWRLPDGAVQKHDVHAGAP